jgi:hypothetical protein
MDKPREYKNFGEHDYDKNQNVAICKHGCGCTRASFMSDGPPGIDPYGKCPNNPLNGPRRDSDYGDYVDGRIRELELKLHKAKEAAGGIVAFLKMMDEMDEQLRQIRPPEDNPDIRICVD